LIQACDTVVLVCGLGSLGQLCLQRLLAFGVELHALDRVIPLWREPGLEDHLRGCLTVGDMRLPWVLRRAGVQAAQAVLLLTSDSSANIEAALQVRLLNPKARIVVRSGGHQTGLGSLLEDRLAGITVVDPTLLCAGAIATALRPPDEPLQVVAWSALSSIYHRACCMCERLRWLFAADPPPWNGTFGKMSWNPWHAPGGDSAANSNTRGSFSSPWCSLAWCSSRIGAVGSS
jgi:hypothetical protein